MANPVNPFGFRRDAVRVKVVVSVLLLILSRSMTYVH